MINYIICKDNSYSLNDTNILQFMLLAPLPKVKKVIDKLTKKILAINGFLVKAKSKTSIIYNYSIAIKFCNAKVTRLAIIWFLASILSTSSLSAKTSLSSHELYQSLQTYIIKSFLIFTPAFLK